MYIQHWIKMAISKKVTIKIKNKNNEIIYFTPDSADSFFPSRSILMDDTWEQIKRNKKGE